MVATTSHLANKFQSTPPARGATIIDGRLGPGRRISIHAPREGGDNNSIKINVHISISIHAPREGGDQSPRCKLSTRNNFNPRPPRGGRPPSRRKIRPTKRISIHAPREGGDLEDVL